MITYLPSALLNYYLTL